MAELKLGYIKPVGADNVVVEGKYVKGGYFAAESKAALDALINEDMDNLVNGSLAYAAAEAKTYRFDGTAWIEESSSSEFVIQDPQNGQILMYDAASGKWVNRILAKDESIIYLTTDGLTIKGLAEANAGDMLVKNSATGISWKKPLDESALNTAVADAKASAIDAGNAKTAAGNSAAEAVTAAATAERINTKTMNFVNDKFWWGTLEEYNTLTSISKDTFYFITPEE